MKDSDQEEVSQGYFKIIDQPVWDDPELSAWEILLYGQIQSLARMKGYAFASNRAYVDMMPPRAFKNCSSQDSKERMLKRWLSNLQDREHIFIFSSKKGFSWNRKIYTALTIRSKKDYEGTSTSPPEDIHDPSEGNSTSPLEQHNSNNINIKREESSLSPLLSFGEFQRIKLTQEDYDDLEKRFGKQKLEQLITAVDGNLEERGITRKNYKATILNWERREKTFNSQAKKEDLQEKNKAYAHQVVKTLKANLIPKEVRIHANSSYLEIGSKDHPLSTIIKFYEHGFKEQVENELRKRGVLKHLT